MKMNPPIVVVAFNRPRSLRRLFQSIAEANYQNGDVDLIISIDKSPDNQDVLEMANLFKWNHGKKEVRYQDENLGLKKHILQCGSLSLDYGNVIVLEDDLYVSPNFYEYTRQALLFSEKEPLIGGISLYNHMLNVHTFEHFYAIDDGFDNWYFQFASSWGQAWSKKQWQSFMGWYGQNPNLEEMVDLPTYVKSWSDKSWLKYNIAYLIAQDQYFLYPRTSMTTNFSDAGTHVGQDSTLYQVPLSYGKKGRYNFSKIQDSMSVYDAYFENLRLAKALNLEHSELAVDLYAHKPNSKKRFLLTSKVLDFKIQKTFGKSLKPHEDNVLNCIEGNEIFLYDTNEVVSNTHKQELDRKATYDFKHIPYSLLSALFFKSTFKKIRSIPHKLSSKS